MKEILRKELSVAASLVDNFINDESQISKLVKASELLATSIKSNNKIISCGNGGSMSDAMHFAEELTGKFRESRSSIPAIAISDPGHISCVANDFGYEFIFSRFIESLGNKGDVLVAISTSGNSANVINASLAAKERGLKVIGLTGGDGGELIANCDIAINIPHDGYADRIQEMHIKVIHLLIQLVENQLS